MAKTTLYVYNLQLRNRTQVYPYNDALIYIFLGNDDGDTFLFGSLIGGPAYLNDSGNAIAAWWRSKRLDFGDQYAEFVGHFKTVDRVQLEYVDEYASTPVTVAISDDGGEHWIYRTRVLGNGDGRQKVADFYFHDKDRITSKDFTVKLLSADDDTSFTWTGIYVLFEPRGPFQEI